MDHDSLGVVTRVGSSKYAYAWLMKERREIELFISKEGPSVVVGDWVRAKIQEDGRIAKVFEKVPDALETRVLEDGKIIQVKATVYFDDENNRPKAAHGYLIRSEEFGMVAVFVSNRTVISGIPYITFVERIPPEYKEMQQETGAGWFLHHDAKLIRAKKESWKPPVNSSPNFITSAHDPASRRSNEIKAENHKASIRQLTRIDGVIVSKEDHFTGVVVSKSGTETFVWTPELGEGICPRSPSLDLGKWIQFSARPTNCPERSANIRFVVNTWQMTQAVLKSTPVNNTIMLDTTVFIPEFPSFPLNDLTADWIGKCVDFDGILFTALKQMNLRGKAINIRVRRVKKSRANPVTVWNVCNVMAPKYKDQTSSYYSEAVQKGFGTDYCIEAVGSNADSVHPANISNVEAAAVMELEGVEEMDRRNSDLASEESIKIEPEGFAILRKLPQKQGVMEKRIDALRNIFTRLLSFEDLQRNLEQNFWDEYQIISRFVTSQR